MRKEIEDRPLTDEAIAETLYQCHGGLMKAYQSQKLFSDELYHLSQLAKITGDLVNIRVLKKSEEHEIKQKGDTNAHIK